MLTEAALKSKKKKTTSPLLPILLNTVYRRPLQNYFFVLKYVCVYVQFHDIFLYVQILSVSVPLPPNYISFHSEVQWFYIVIFLEHREIYQLFTFHEFNFLFKFCEIKILYLCT